MNLELDITPEGKRFKIEAKSPCGNATGFLDIDPSLTSRMYEIQECIDEQKRLDEKYVTDLGTNLFKMLFSDIKDVLHQCFENYEHTDIILNTAHPDVTAIPWELSYDPDYHIFLGADPRCSLVRRDHQIKEVFSEIDYPLKVLVIISSPMDLDEKGEYQPDPDEITTLMEPLKPLEEEGKIKMDFLERAQVNRIQDKLKEGYHIVHFIGHGVSGDEAGLLIEGKERNSKVLHQNEVSQLFGISPPRLLFFSACESSPLIPFFVSRKVPAVLAMQLSVFVDVAHEFVERFYSFLVKGDSITQAVSQARSYVLLEEGKGCTGWFTPVLYVWGENVLKINTKSPPRKPVKKTHGQDRMSDLIGVENFVGRRKDLWLIEKAFEEGLKGVVVTGIGGIGKSALASKFVKRHKEEFSAVCAVKVADSQLRAEGILGFLDQFLVENNDFTLHTVMKEFDLKVKLEALTRCLNNYLIILDNFELLVKDKKIADEDVEKVVQTLLYGNHTSKIVITTRYDFIFRDEKGFGLMREVEVGELGFQAANELLRRLGVEDVEVRKKIYEKVGGNPQFLEFFVQLGRTKPLEELFKDITLVREKIGVWLLDRLVGLLDEGEKEVLKNVSVFRLPFSGDAFTGGIDRLVYYKLVRVDGLYSMHQGVREYVHGLLSEGEWVEAHRKAAAYYETLTKREGKVWDVLELHYHLVESEDYEKAGDLVLGLSEVFLRWGYWTTLLELLVQTVRTTEGRTKAGGLHNLGMVLQSQGNYREAEKYYRESLELAKDLGDKQGIASSLHNLGIIQQLQGNYREAEKYYRESLELAKDLGDKQGIASSLHNLGIIQQLQGNYREAEKYYRESLERAKDLGDKQVIASSLHQLGIIQQLQGNYREAEKYYRESLELKKDLGDKQGIARSLHQLGIIQQLQGNYREAEKYYRESLERAKDLGDKQGIASSLHQLGIIQQLQGNYREAEKYYRESLELKKDLGDKQGIARSLHQLGIIQQLQGNYREAEKYYSESLELAKDLGDKQGIATSLHQLGMIYEANKAYRKALEHYATSLSIFSEINSPDAMTAINSLHRLRELMGESFDEHWRTLTKTPVPHYIKAPPKK